MKQPAPTENTLEGWAEIILGEKNEREVLTDCDVITAKLHNAKTWAEYNDVSRTSWRHCNTCERCRAARTEAREYIAALPHRDACSVT